MPVLKNKTNDEFKTELIYVTGNCAPPIYTINKSKAEFKRGGKSIFDYERSGHPKRYSQEMVD